MRWHPLSERTKMFILAPIVWPIALAALPILLPVGGLAWATDKFASWRRARNARNPRRQWFAWRPVKFSAFWEADDVHDQWLWLETVDAVWQTYRWEYRPLGFVSRFDEPALATPATSA